MRKYIFILYGEVSWSLEHKIPIHGYRGTKTQFELYGKPYLESLMTKEGRNFEIRRAKISRTQELCYDGNTEKTILFYKGGNNEQKNKTNTHIHRRGNFISHLMVVCGLVRKRTHRPSMSEGANNPAVSGENN